MSDNELSCEEVIEQLFEYLDQRLGAEEITDIHRHLERCRECFSRAEFEKRLRARIVDAGETKAPDRLRMRIARVLDEF